MIPSTPERSRKRTLYPSSAVQPWGVRFESAALTPSNSPSVVRIWSTTCGAYAPNQPPPCDASDHHSGTSDPGWASSGMWRMKVARRGSPIAPSRTTRRSSSWPVAHRNSAASAWTTPAASAAASMVRASAVSRAKGFSQMTCLPAAMASSASGPWVCGGVAIATASTSGSASASENVVVA